VKPAGIPIPVTFTSQSLPIEEEEEAMEQVIAEALEDEWLDDGAIKIGSDEEYQ
jgi:hypothetical protein